MPAKKLSIPVTPDMTKALDELCELHALQLPSLASMLLRDALAGRRSPLLPKRVSAPQIASEAKNGSEPVQTPQGEKTPSGGAWSPQGGKSE